MGGGLTGLIQSALNQVFSSAWPSSQHAGTPQGAQPPSSSSGSTTSNVASAASTTSAATSSSTLAAESSSEDDTPAARRQRLDSEFVDLDFD